MAETKPAPMAATVPASGAELRNYIYYVQQRLAKGSKSDIDKIVPVLEVFLVWSDALLANQLPEAALIKDVLDR